MVSYSTAFIVTTIFIVSTLIFLFGVLSYVRAKRAQAAVAMGVIIFLCIYGFFLGSSVLFLGVYLTFFTSYIAGVYILLGGGYYLSKHRNKQGILVAAVCLIIGGLCIYSNYLSLQPEDPAKAGIAQMKKNIQKEKREAALVNFPVYDFTRSGYSQSASVVTRHPPVHILYSLHGSQKDISIYEYAAGGRPYTLSDLPDGSCAGYSGCVFLAKTTFGDVYTVSNRGIQTGLFSTDGKTSIYINSTDNAAAIDVFNSAKAVKADKLPFTGS